MHNLINYHLVESSQNWETNSSLELVIQIVMTHACDVYMEQRVLLDQPKHD